MKKIPELLVGVNTLSVTGDTGNEISSICFDSRKASKNSLFVAIDGVLTDGNRFVLDAIRNGAIIIVSEKEYPNKEKNVTYVCVENCRSALAIIANNFYDNPSQKLKLVGVTGTNGKTTIATLLFNLFRKLGFHCALISTIENKIDDQIYGASQTTPDPISTSSLLAEAVERGCSYAFMECSSHCSN